ncbi:MAG: hypothetical protein JST13_09275 [Bacteroidetes bacterium]|nr:hypothetical protein [Bacteroidota bacterium]
MNNDLLNILTNDNQDFDNQKLIDYLNGKLPPQEKHEVEKWMADNHIANDAIEGLQHIKDKKNLSLYVGQLNKNLHEQLQKNKARHTNPSITQRLWVYIAAILILALCIIGFYILRMLLVKQGH